MKIKEVVNYLLERFPLETAVDYDQPKLGFVIGDENREITKIMLTLDLTFEVLMDALSNGCNLIISHHPFIYTPTHKILLDNEKGRIIEIMMKRDISLFSMHTNLDVGFHGIDDVWATRLALANVQGENEKGSFLRVGEIKPTKFSDFYQFVMEQFDVNGARIVGDDDKIIKKVGLCSGSGGNEKDIDDAISHHCDCYISGEIKLPAAQKAKYNDLCLIEVNHGVEKIVFYYLAKEMEEDLKLQDKIIVTKVNTDPLRTVINNK